MDFEEYSKKALKTKGNYNDKLDKIINGAMGLNGEAGEVIDIIKKFMYQGHEFDVKKIKDELGDVLWYVNLCADAIGYTLEDIAKTNINKLEKRYPQGYFRAEDSVNRIK